MTTIEREHEFRMFCQGSSNRRMYKELCHRRGLKRNSRLYSELADNPNRFDLKSLDFTGNYLGPEGVRTLLPIITANEKLEKLNLAGQGLTDSCMADLAKVLREHPRITAVDLSENEGVTNASAGTLFSLLRDNTMLCSFNVSGCRLAKAYVRKIQELADYNEGLEPHFFRGNYLKMKLLFTQLDSDMSGQITMSELLTNIEVPRVAATLLSKMERFTEKREQVTINQFLDLVYPHYRSEESIREYSRQEDIQEVHTARNHLTLFNQLTRRRLVADHYKMIRVTDTTLSEQEVARLVDRALEIESTLHSDGAPQRNGRIVLSYYALKHALSEVWQPPKRTIDEIRREFRLPPTMVKQVCLLFGTQRELTIAEVLAQHLETTLTKLQLRILVPIIQKVGLPTTDMPMTLQETITLLEEYYDAIVYEKV